MLKNYNLFLFDMDGTLYLGDQLYDFTKELLDTIREKGKRYLFMTNNSSKSVLDYVKKLESLSHIFSLDKIQEYSTNYTGGTQYELRLFEKYTRIVPCIRKLY